MQFQQVESIWKGGKICSFFLSFQSVLFFSFILNDPKGLQKNLNMDVKKSLNFSAPEN